MTTLTRSRCFAPPSTAQSFLPKALPISTTLAPGRSASCIGTTSSIGTAAFVTSARLSAMPARIKPFSRLDMPCMPRLANSTRHAGQGRLGTGRPVGAVTLNPERDCIVKAHSAGTTIFSHWLHDRGDNYLDARRWIETANGAGPSTASTTASPLGNGGRGLKPVIPCGM
jgi:hypothetical protein